jgi:NAD(P)-dependent dehydrogenase (short-subunit alcohol dehydrogenase family)
MTKSPESSLAGKVALVTGGSQGIGKAIALGFAEAGANVAVCSRGIKEGQLEGVAEDIQRLGRKSMAIRADTSRKSDVENMVEKVMDQFGAIDILVNNAGILIRTPLLELTEEAWDKLLDVDLKGYFLCAQAVGKRMVQRKKGNIINISTQFAFRAPTVGMGAYAIAKAGVVMLTRVLAQELGRYGIRANSIAPGLTRTEFSRASWSNPELMKQVEASLPLGRIAESVDLVGTALFLASDASSYVTGNTILLEGGGLA